jgi:hypothetical protein
LKCAYVYQYFADSNPADSNGFLRAIKNHSMTSFGGEVKPLATFRKILRHVKDPLMYDRYTIGKIQRPFLAQFLPGSLLDVSAATKADNSGG